KVARGAGGGCGSRQAFRRRHPVELSRLNSLAGCIFPEAEPCQQHRGAHDDLHTILCCGGLRIFFRGPSLIHGVTSCECQVDQLADSELSPLAMTGAIVTFYSCKRLPADRPRVLRSTAPRLVVASDRLSKVQHLSSIHAQPRLSTWASTVGCGIRTRIRAPCDGSDSTDSCPPTNRSRSCMLIK